jgi:hypothetical protein
MKGICGGGTWKRPEGKGRSGAEAWKGPGSRCRHPPTKPEMSSFVVKCDGLRCRGEGGRWDDRGRSSQEKRVWVIECHYRPRVVAGRGCVCCSRCRRSGPRWLWFCTTTRLRNYVLIFVRATDVMSTESSDTRKFRLASRYRVDQRSKSRPHGKRPPSRLTLKTESCP